MVASPQPGSTFGGWLGCDSTSGPVVDGNNSTCTVILNADTTVTAIFNLIVSDLEECIIAFDNELETLLQEIKEKDVAGTRAAVEAVLAQGAICNDLIDDLRKETLPELKEGPAETDDTLVDARISEGVLEAIIHKLEAELQAKKGWLSLVEGVKDGILAGVRAISNGPTAGKCTAANLGKTSCDDLLDFVQTLGVNHIQSLRLWSGMEEAVRRMIDIKVRMENIVFHGIIKGGQRRCNPDLGANQCHDFADLDNLGRANPTYQGLMNDIDATLACLDNPDTGPGCQPWYLNPLAVGLSVAGVADVIPLSVSKVYAAPNPASQRNDGLVRFVAEGAGINQVRVEVFDLAGAKVFDSGFQAGRELSWNLLNNASRPVANGVYLYVVTAQGYGDQVSRSQVHKLVVLK